MKRGKVGKGRIDRGWCKQGGKKILGMDKREGKGTKIRAGEGKNGNRGREGEVIVGRGKKKNNFGLGSRAS